MTSTFKQSEYNCQLNSTDIRMIHINIKANDQLVFFCVIKPEIFVTFQDILLDERFCLFS